MEKATTKVKSKEAVLARSKDKKKDGEPIKFFNYGCEGVKRCQEKSGFLAL